MEKYQWRKSLALVLIFQVASQKSEVFFFTGVYKKIFREPPHGCFQIMIFLSKYLN